MNSHIDSSKRWEARSTNLIGNFQLGQLLGDVDCIQYTNDSKPTDIVTLQVQRFKGLICFQGLSNGLQQ